MQRIIAAEFKEKSPSSGNLALQKQYIRGDGLSVEDARLKNLISSIAPLVLLGMSAVPSLAAPVAFSGTTTWTQVEGSGNNSGDTFVFLLTAAPDLGITQIDFVLGNGTAAGASSSLWWDLNGAPVNGGAGAYSAAVTSGTVTTTDPLAQTLTLLSRAGAVTFTSFTPGNSATITGDVDKTLPAANCSGNCDLLNFTDFTSGGGFTFTVYFASTNPSLTIVGPSSFTFGPVTGWTSGTFGGQPGASIAWAGVVEMVDPSPVPEPAPMFLVGAGLIFAGMWRRKKTTIQ